IELFNGDACKASTPDNDVSTFLGKEICPAGVAVRPLESEVVPCALFKIISMTTLEHEMIGWGKLLFERRLVSGWGGNLSCRLDKKCFMITGQHAPLGFFSPKDLGALDQNGKPINTAQRASSETPMHLAVYAGTDAQAIVHVHPPMVLAFSLTHESFVPLSYEEKYTIGEVPIILQDTPTVTRPQV